MKRRIIFIIIGAIWLGIGAFVSHIANLTSVGSFYLGTFFGAILFAIFDMLDETFNF